MAQMAVGDALAMAVMAARGFTVEDYARTHPAGALGRKVLLRVADLMHSGEANPTVPASASVLDALMVMSNSPIRGAVSVLEEDSRLAGFFTDGDFRSLMRREGDWGAVMRRPVAEVMTRRPTTTSPETMAAEAALLMQRRQFDNLPVLDAEGRVVGMLDIQDLVGAGLA
jgi:arabinose-5-phosphate isomerase